MNILRMFQNKIKINSNPIIFEQNRVNMVFHKYKISCNETSHVMLCSLTLYNLTLLI